GTLTCSPTYCAALPRLETTIVYSVGVFQCQGTTQPLSVFTSITEPSFDGSPFSTDNVLQVGRPGIFVNLAVALAAYTILLESSARAGWTLDPTTRTASSRQQQVVIRMRSS